MQSKRGIVIDNLGLPWILFLGQELVLLRRDNTICYSLLPSYLTRLTGRTPENSIP